MDPNSRTTRRPNPRPEDFLNWLLKEEGTIACRDLGDGFYLCVRQLLFHYTMILGEIGDTVGYLDRWCYNTLEQATGALNAEWDGSGDAPGEWHKHPNSGRVKFDGVIYADIQEAFRAGAA
jgi:hypothetical protein